MVKLPCDHFCTTARLQGFYSFSHSGSWIKQYTSSISVIRRIDNEADEYNHHASAFQDCNLDNANKCPFYSIISSFPQSNCYHWQTVINISWVLVNLLNTQLKRRHESEHHKGHLTRFFFLRKPQQHGWVFFFLPSTFFFHSTRITSYSNHVCELNATV